MNVIAIHKITDQAKFWETLRTPAKLPDGIKVQSVLPSVEGTTAVCIWQADSVETVEKLVVSTVGQYSKNEFFAVDASTAFGIPG